MAENVNYIWLILIWFIQTILYILLRYQNVGLAVLFWTISFLLMVIISFKLGEQD